MQDRKTVLLVGSTSDIGRAAARAYAEAGYGIMLAARDPQRAQRDADDIATRSGHPVELHVLDVLDTNALAGFVEKLSPLPHTVVCLVGELGEQTRAETDLAHAAHIIQTNFTAPALLLGLFARDFQKRGFGTIIGVSSVAGDRGRASNYLYGSAKAGFSAFLSGLRNRLNGYGVKVITVKPGFVRTRMTAGLKLPPLLTAEADEVGRAILQAGEKGRDVVYVRPIWRVVMAIIRAMPEAVFKRLKI